MWNHNQGANPFGFPNQNNAWNMGMPQQGVWGFQQHQPQMPPMQPFLHGQGMMPPAMGHNFFPNSVPPITPTQANVMPNQQSFPHIQPPPVPPPQHQNTNGFNPLGINLNRPPPPPPEIAVPSQGDNMEGFNRLGDNGNRNSAERRTGDWNCSQCQNHNFAWRKSCGRCNCERSFGEEVSNVGPNQGNQEVGNCLTSLSWQCPRCKVLNVNGSTHCPQCHFMNPKMANSSSNEFQNQNRDRFTEEQNTTNQKPSNQEEEFDRMFSDWEAGFESWKRENHNNPDQNYVRQHIHKMNEMRETMLKRRENLKRQRQQTNQNVYDKPNAILIEGEPSNKVPRLLDGPSINNGTGPVPRRASRWEQHHEGGDQGKSGEISTPPVTIEGQQKDRRPGDWNCMRCNKLQFAFRHECKFCNLTKSESERREKEGNVNSRNDNSAERTTYSLENRDNNSSKNLFQTRQDLQSSLGDNAHPSRTEDNLFQRREPSKPPNERAHFSGNSSQSRFDNPNSRSSRFDNNGSAKVVDYGHGNKQAKSPWIKNEDKKREEWPSSSSDHKNSQDRRQRYEDEKPFQDRRANKHLNLTEHKPFAEAKQVPYHQHIAAKPPEPQGEQITIDDLIKLPGRNTRPSKLVIIFRGLPGAGKTFIVKHIKSQESEMGGEAPRILSLDDYFECDGKYEYEEEMEKMYVASLIKSFKKQIDDGYFSLILVDCINDKTEHYQPMWSYAKQKGFEVYVGTVDCDPSICASRNIHDRNEKDIQTLHRGWEPTPSHFNKVDFSSFLQDKGIEHVEMADAEDDIDNPVGDESKPSKATDESKGDQSSKDSSSVDSSTNKTQNEDDLPQSSDAGEMGEAPFALPSSSKWEVADRQEKMAKLDGVSVQAIKRMEEAHHSSINDWLEIESEEKKDTRKKKVRWADIEERRKQVKLRDIGFVVGQTNWKRYMDPNEGTQQALERTKIIPNRFDDRS